MRSAMRVAFLAFAALIVLGVPAANGQQTEQRRTRSPKLTTEDVVRPSSARTTETQPTDIAPNKAGTEVKSTASLAGGVKKDSEVKPTSEKHSPDEQAWRERIAQARTRAQSLERAAEEAEIRATELRNQLNQSGQSANDRNAIAAQMDQTGKQVTELRTQTREAKAELNQLLEEGAEKGYKESAPPKSTTTEGKPNESYYRQRYDKLTQAMHDAERKVQLYENRLRSLNEMITNPNRDRFSGAQLEQDRNDAQDSLSAARTAYQKAQDDLTKLMEEARRAGVPPGIFR